MTHLTPRQLRVIWHSCTGGAHAMALAFSHGAGAEPAVQCTLLEARQARADNLLVADGYAFVCPEMLGSMSGVMKDFFDRTYYPLLDRIQGRPCLIMVCAGSDGSGAVRQMQRIITGWRLREISPPVIVCTHAQTPDVIAAPKVLSPHDVQMCHDSGQAFAAGLGMGLF